MADRAEEEPPKKLSIKRKTEPLVTTKKKKNYTGKQLWKKLQRNPGKMTVMRRKKRESVAEKKKNSKDEFWVWVTRRDDIMCTS